MKFNSIKFKVSALHVIILGVVLIVYSIFLYFSLYTSLYGELNSELGKKAEVISDGINTYLEILHDKQKSLMHVASRVITRSGEYLGEDRNVTPVQRNKIMTFEQTWDVQHDKLDLSEDFIHFVSVDGKTISLSKNVSLDLRKVFLKKLKLLQDKDFMFNKIKFQKKNLQMIQVPFSYKGKTGFVIQVATTQKPIVKLLNERQKVIFISIPILLVLTFFIGRFLVGRILTPVANITERAKDITHENLSDRLNYDYGDEEMRMLVEAFNDMISRLEKSFQHIAEFSSQVAHELKTPIAIIRGECEIALRKVRTPEEYKRVIEVNLEETHRMLKTIDDLLLLAKLDYRPEIFNFEEFDAHKFFNEIYEQSKILASKKKVKVEYDPPKNNLKLKGDILHLRRLFFNIIDNAIKFTPDKGKIYIEVNSKNENVLIDIKDTGPGVKTEDLPKVFDRFFHKPLSEDSPDPGNGLGLSISLSIAKIHEGTISVHSQGGQGAKFTVSLPVI